MDETTLFQVLEHTPRNAFNRCISGQPKTLFLGPSIKFNRLSFLDVEVGKHEMPAAIMTKGE